LYAWKNFGNDNGRMKKGSENKKKATTKPRDNYRYKRKNTR